MSAVKKINKKFRASLYITLYCIYRSDTGRNLTKSQL